MIRSRQDGVVLRWAGTMAVAVTIAFVLPERTLAQLQQPTKIGFSQGVFVDRLSDLDRFGSAVARLGDLDGDDVEDLAVGAPFDDDGGHALNSDRGAVWILFMNQDGSVKAHAKISESVGGFQVGLNDRDRFGSSIAALGDLDRDGTLEIAVGSPYDNDGGRDRGAVWILSVSQRGTVTRQSRLAGSLGIGETSDDAHFGASVAAIGEASDGGFIRLAVGAPYRGDQNGNAGAIWMLEVGPELEIRSQYRIDATKPPLNEVLDAGDEFGSAIAYLGDLDRDGNDEIAVGAPLDDEGSSNLNANYGAVWILNLLGDNSISVSGKLDNSSGSFMIGLNENDRFGSSLGALGDLNGDGTVDLAVGVPLDDAGNMTPTTNKGATWIFFLNQTGSIEDAQKIGTGVGDFRGDIREDDRFGAALAPVGDIDGDGVIDLAVGAPLDDDGGISAGSDRGGVWILFLRANGTTRPEVKISGTTGGFAGTIDDGDQFGTALARLGRSGVSSQTRVLVGAPGDDDGVEDAGAVWVLALENGSIARVSKISNLEGSLGSVLAPGGRFGSSLSNLGDIDGDGIADLAVGAPHDDEGATDAGALWILLLDESGDVRRASKIANELGGFDGILAENDLFGSSAAQVGDLDGDGIAELAVGAPGPTSEGPDRGVAWILFLNPDATIRRTVRLSPAELPVASSLGVGFGSAVLGPGDLDRDGIGDLLVSAPGEVYFSKGTIWTLYLNANGTVRSASEFTSQFASHPFFSQTGQAGKALAAPGDLNKDGRPDVVLSSVREYREGSVWLALLGDSANALSLHHHDATTGDLEALPLTESEVAWSLASLGDINGDGINDLAIGAPGDNDGGVRRGSVWISYNALIPPPTISEALVEPALPTPGERLVVRAAVHALNGARNVAVNFKTSGDADFLEASLTQTDDGDFRLAIPSFVTANRGIEYFLTAENVHGHQTRYPAVGVISVPVYLADGLMIEPDAGSVSDEYRLYSVPLALDDPSALQMLTSSLGAVDRKSWRFYGYNDDVHRHELEDGDMALSPGSAFWLLVKDQRSALSTGPGTTVPTNQPFRIALEPGWNYVGNPFNFPVSLSKLTLASGEPTDVRTYQGFWTEVTNNIEGMEGYAVFSDHGADTLTIDPDVSSEPVSDPGFGFVHEEASTEGWAIRILAESGRSFDNDNVAGSAKPASAGRDPYDRPEPPLIGDFVSVYFPHPEWDYVTDRFSTDIRPVGESGDVWDFAIRTAVTAPVRLVFSTTGSMPPHLRISIEDVDFGEGLRLLPDSSLVVGSFSGGQARNLRLVVRDASTAEDADRHGHEEDFATTLHPVYPNPLSRIATIRFDLSETQSVTLRVIDPLGRTVTSLAHGFLANGRHTFVWDTRNDAGQEVGTGMYFVRLEAGLQSESRTIVVAR